jgi:ABC-type transport system substrate-binding protein
MEQGTKTSSVKMGRTRKVTIAIAVAAVVIMVLSVLGATGVAGVMGPLKVSKAVTTEATPWTYPTTTMQEPNYTGGTYITAATVDVEYLNVWKYSDLYSGMLLDELYDTAAAFVPNQTYIPWAASSYTEATAPAGLTYFDPLTGANESVAYTWTVTLRPNIQWSDWTPGNAHSTYLYSNYTAFSLDGTPYTATYPWPSLTMNTYTMQSADLILSWLIMESSMDYSPDFANIVNIVPVSNLTAEFLLSAQSATFVTSTLGTPIIPYHVWQPHDCAAATTYAWNYTGSCALVATPGHPQGYDVWNVGYNAATGTSNDLIGSGPFMFTNDYGEPQGSWVVGNYWELYVNPHYFAQYVPSLEQFTPKIFELYTPLYLSESDAVTAFLLGQADTVLNGVDPTYIPTIDTDPNAFIFYQPSGAFGFIQLNSWGAGQAAIPGTKGFLPEVTNAPFNITAVRQAMNYATDKAYLASVVDEGYDTLGQPVIPSADAIWHNFTANQYSYNPTLAESMLAGVPGMTKNSAGDWLYNGAPVTLNIQTTVASADPLGVEGDEIVAQEWTAVGIPTTVTQEAFASLLPPLFGFGYSAISLGITGIAGDPTSYLIEVYNASIGIGNGFYNGPFSSLTWNGTAYTGTQIDLLMGNLTTQLNSITDLAKRIAIADEIEGIAAAESVIVNTGYPVAIIPFNNATYTGLEENSLPYSSYMYYNYLSFALKTPTKVTPPSTPPTQLKVGVVAPTTVFTDGQYGNVTIQVRNQYGQPEPGMNVAIGFNPEGMLLNVSSDAGVTNSSGVYTWEFQVLNTNGGIYTADYGGEINVTAAATPPAALVKSVIAGLGWTYIDVEPVPVAFYATNNTALTAGGAAQALNILAYNPLTGAPISGYRYAVEALSGAVNLTATSSAQTITQTSDAPYASVLVGGVADNNITEVTGTTGSNGIISVDVQQNGSSNLTADGAPFQTWLFIGAYHVTATVPGAPPYGAIAEVTSAFDAVPSGDGYGVLEPAEIPITVSADPAVSISLSVNSTTVGPSGTLQVTVTVTNSVSHTPVAGANVTVYAQNDFGANRGYLTNGTGTDVLAFNPNGYFASYFLPGLQMTTAANGQAISTFSPGLYKLEFPGGLATYEPVAYKDSYLIPADDWELAAYVTNATGVINSTTADTQIVSTQQSTPATPTPFATAYIAGAVVTQNGVVSVAGSSTDTLYVNTTENGPAGPVAGGISVIAITTTLGTVTPTSGTTSAAGTLTGTVTIPAVAAPAVMVITVEYSVGSGTANTTVTVFVVPSTAKTITTTTSTNLDLYYALIAVFAVLTVIFAALWVSARGRRMPPAQGWSGATGGTGPSQGSGGMDTTSQGPGTGGSGGPPGGT